MSSWVQDRAAATPLAAVTPLRIIMGLTVVAAFAMERLATGNTDVSWLLTLCERWLAGEVPYVDFIEVNPPASIMLYMPAVVLARGLGIAPELATTALTVLASLASVGLSGAILLRAGLVTAAARDVLAAVALVLLLLVPAGNFAEREHLAVVAMLPMLALLASRSVGVGAGLALAILAGVGGGVAMAIKPMFALGLAGPILFLLLRQGLRRTLLAPEIHAAWIVTGVYGVSVLLFFPGFTTPVLGWVLTAYVPVRCSAVEMLASPLSLAWFALLGTFGIVMIAPRRNAAALVLALASIGFEVVFFGQAKNWSYQALPGILLLALAIAVQIAQPQPTARFAWLRPLGAALTALLCVQYVTMTNMVSVVDIISPGLRAAVARVSPHPRLLAITVDMAVAFPLVRELEGRWVGSLSSNWLTTGLQILDKRGQLTPEHRTELEGLRDRERAIVTADIVNGKPDVILLQSRWWDSYVAPSPALSAAFANYRSDGSYGPITLWVRKSAS